MEVPRIEVELELQLPAYTTATAISATYTTAHSNARSFNPLSRAGEQTLISWILVGFVTAEPRREALINVNHLEQHSCAFSERS